MPLFVKREEVFCKRDKAGWEAAQEALKAAGIRGVRARHCEVEPPVGGCGCKLDIRNFGPRGRIDRESTLSLSRRRKWRRPVRSWKDSYRVKNGPASGHMREGQKVRKPGTKLQFPALYCQKENHGHSPWFSF